MAQSLKHRQSDPEGDLDVSDTFVGLGLLCKIYFPTQPMI